MAQWPITKDKLEHLHSLVQEQLAFGHLQPSMSPWNTPVFVIQKKSGKWRFLHDLRAVNNQMHSLGILQPGLPSPAGLPKYYHLFIIDIKDCFFSIPLHPEDTKLFAFSVPSINHSAPMKRYEWVVLPQGMKNSPTICQWFVDQALHQWRLNNPNFLTYHYMDGILVASEFPLPHLKQKELLLELENWGLKVAEEKVQFSDPWSYLGFKITQARFVPQKVTLHANIETVNYVQKLLGDIQSIRAWASISNQDLDPLRKLLQGSKDINDKRELTQERKQALQIIAKKLHCTTAFRFDPTIPINLYIINYPAEQIAIIGQESFKTFFLLEWVFLACSPTSSVTRRIDHLGSLILKARQRVRTVFGVDASSLYVPINNLSLCTEWQSLSYTFATATIGLELDNHYPSHALFSTNLPLKGQTLRNSKPIPNAITVFTDASGRTKRFGYAIWKNGNWDVVVYQHPEGSVQLLELKAVTFAFQHFDSQEINLVSDSLYVASILERIEDALIGRISNSLIYHELILLVNVINIRHHAFFSTHIRSHLNLPGFLSEGNAKIDQIVSSPAIGLSNFDLAVASHAFFHQSALSLQKEFHLTKREARGIVACCPDCAKLPPIQLQGVNPRGLHPRTLFQSDVTIVPSFGRFKHVHVTVDTCSRLVWATPMINAKSKATCRHWLEAFAVLGVPQQIKTDNGPNYVSSTSREFLRRWNITHVTGVPHNSTGQAIVERKHQDLKRLFSALQREGNVTLSPQEIVAKTLYVHNWKMWMERPELKTQMLPITLHFCKDESLFIRYKYLYGNSNHNNGLVPTNY